MKLPFAILAIAWMLVWLLSLLAIGGLMGSSPAILLIYIGMAFAPPGLLYLVLFRAIPWIAKKRK